MSLYNLVYGMSPAVFYLLPMLGKHPDHYPRFRDAFPGRLLNDVKKDTFGIPMKYLDQSRPHEISVYMRIGGGNRESYEDQIKELKAMPNYVMDYDDGFDSTFATFIFTVPDRWKADYDIICSGKEEWNIVSKEYLEEMCRVFPKIEDKLRDTFKEKK